MIHEDLPPWNTTLWIAFDNGLDFTTQKEVETIDSSVETESAPTILWNNLSKFLQSLIASKVLALEFCWFSIDQPATCERTSANVPRDHLCRPFLTGATKFTNLQVGPARLKEASQTIQKSPTRNNAKFRNSYHVLELND